MIKQDDYPIVGSFNNQRVTNIDSERSVNVFEYRDVRGKKQKVLIFTSGIGDSEIVFSGANGGSRGEFVLGNNHYIVFGSNVYAIDNSNTAILLIPDVVFPATPPAHSLTTTTGYVGIDANQAADPQVIFVDGDRGYIYDTVTTVFSEITDTSFPVKPIDVCFIDGFFLVANGDTNLFELSMLNNGFVWGPAANHYTTTVSAAPSPFAIGASTLTGGVSGTANYQTGTPVQFSNSVDPTHIPITNPPINTTDTFYTITLYSSPGIIDPLNVGIAISLANALAGIGVEVTNIGSDVQTITSLGQLQQGAITSHPGTIVACRTLHRRIFLFSQNFTEVWENAGIGTNLPIRRNNSLLMEVGTPAIGSIATGFDKMFFLSQDKDGLGSVMEVVGTQAIPVSTRALDFQLAQYASNPDFLIPGRSTGVTDARGIMIKENGLIFYRLNFTAANHTYVYNVTLSDPTSEEGKLWHEEEVLNGDRHPAQTHGYFNGKNYYGDYQSPILYVVDSQLHTNNGEVIRRMRIGQPIVPPGYQRTRIDRFQLDLQQGQPEDDDFVIEQIDLLAENNSILTTENDIDIILEDGTGQQISNDNPIVYLSLSKDGGQSYYYRQEALMGKLGERTYRTVWRKLGVIPRGQAVIPRIEYFGTGPFVILGAAWVHEVMPE